jgi:hypothetical protein
MQMILQAQMEHPTQQQQQQQQPGVMAGRAQAEAGQPVCAAAISMQQQT